MEIKTLAERIIRKQNMYVCSIYHNELSQFAEVTQKRLEIRIHTARRVGVQLWTQVKNHSLLNALYINCGTVHSRKLYTVVLKEQMPASKSKTIVSVANALRTMEHCTVRKYHRFRAIMNVFLRIVLSTFH